MPSSLAPAHSQTPNAFGTDGPVMSASRMAVRLPARCIAVASIAVTVLLPTPPLPETTAMTFFTLDLSFSLASRLSFVRSEQLSPQEEQFPLHCSLIVFLLPKFGGVSSVQPKDTPRL